MKNFKKYVVSDAANIRSAIRHMDKIGSGFIIIVDKHQKVYGVISDGLAMTQFPITSAGAIFHVNRYSGKFHGEIVETIPRGTL